MPKTKKSKKRTSDAVELMDRWFGGDPEWDEMVLEEELKARIAQLVYGLRTEAGISQAKLAQMAGTTQPVISKLENADYDGSSLEMLWRVCLALRKRLTVGGPDLPVNKDECYAEVLSA